MNHTRLFYILFLLFIALSSTCYAYNQDEKLWLGLSTTRPLSADERWRYLLFTQARFINQSLPWESALIEGGIGKTIYEGSSIWLGYRFTARNPATGYNPENRFFQQFIARFDQNSKLEWVYRARLEETERKYENQIAMRLRNRLALDFDHAIFTYYFPFVYEEVFFQLNKTDFTTHYFVSENRLFIGGNLRYSKKAWVEIGYINQYRMRLPGEAQNNMSHIISAIYNF